MVENLAQPTDGQSRALPHKCDSVILCCMDFRLRAALGEFEKRSCSGAADLLSMAGGVKALLDSSSRDALLGAIALAMEKHGVRRIVLVNHRDCGAYGGSRAFASESVERQRHERDLREGTAVIFAAFADRFPDMRVKLMFAEMALSGAFSMHSVHDPAQATA